HHQYGELLRRTPAGPGGGVRMGRTPDALAAGDALLAAEEAQIRDTVRQMMHRHVQPDIAQWDQHDAVPVGVLGRSLGAVGLRGMHLEGYGCAGMSATAYGLACLELEAADSGIRSLVSVQGSLAMYAIHAYGSEEQKQQWLPPMATGEAIGCFGLTESDHG